MLKSEPAYESAKADAARPRKPGKTARRTQTERSEDTRLRLVEAAAKILHRKGYAGLRTAEVSRVAKVSRGGQLHHFPTKDSLVIAAAEHILKRSSELGRRRAVEVAASDDAIEAIIQDAIDFFFSDDFVTILDLVLSGSKNANIRDRVYASARTYRLPVESAWIDVLVKRGLPGADAEKVLWVTVSVVRGLALRALWQKDEALFRSVLDATKAMLLCHWDSVLKSKRGGKK